MANNIDTLVIRNGSILLSSGELHTGNIFIEDGQIKSIDGSFAESAQQIDATDCYILPGLIDSHVHGLEYDGVADSHLADFAKTEASHGVTTFFPTLFASPAKIAGQMKRHREETNELTLLPQIGGFRLESPYLAIPSGGLASDVAPISSETTKMLLEAGNGHIKIWDVSPELPGAAKLVEELTAQGIVCSIAHTHATIDQAREVVDAGAKLITHMFDVIAHPVMIDPDPDVYPVGLADYLLVEDRVACEIIADGTHVHPYLVEEALRCKPAGKVVFVTDSNLGAGLPPGQYTLPGGWVTVQINGSNDGVRVVDRDMVLAGSALTMLDSFRSAVRLFDRDLANAIAYCSTNPAELLGLNKGSISIGKDADLIILDKSLNLVYTIAGGNIVYHRQSGPV